MVTSLNKDDLVNPIYLAVTENPILKEHPSTKKLSTHM